MFENTPTCVQSDFLAFNFLKASSSRASSFVDSTCKMRNENVSKSVGIWQYDVAVAVALHKLIPAAYAPRHILL